MPDWMAFNVADYVANTLHLTARQHGAYILLICAAWGNKGILPGSDAGLMAIAKLSNKEWKQDGDTLKAFLTRRGEAWVHERVEFEWNDAQALIEAKSKAGKEGARRRWHGRANSSAIAEPQQTHKQNDAPLPLQGSEAKASAPDVASIVFNQAREWLIANTGRSDQECRKLLGKWRKSASDGDIIGAVGAAQRAGAVEPIGYIEGVLRQKAPTKLVLQV